MLLWLTASSNSNENSLKPFIFYFLEPIYLYIYLCHILVSSSAQYWKYFLLISILFVCYHHLFLFIQSRELSTTMKSKATETHIFLSWPPNEWLLSEPWSVSSVSIVYPDTRPYKDAGLILSPLCFDRFFSLTFLEIRWWARLPEIQQTHNDHLISVQMEVSSPFCSIQASVCICSLDANDLLLWIFNIR